MPKISRRGFLTIVVGAAVIVTPDCGADAAVNPGPGTTSPQPRPSAASGKQGTVSASVSVLPQQDVVAIEYTVTNVGSRPDNYSVSYVDEVNGRRSRAEVLHLSPGQTRTGVLYGGVNHYFTLRVGLSDGTELRLGPVGERASARVSVRPLPSPLPQPGRG